MSRRASGRRRAGAQLATLGFLIIASLIAVAPRVAFARGSVTPKKNPIQERKGRWRLDLRINYGGRPDRAVMPVDFIFKKTAVYQRFLTDDSPNEPMRKTEPVKNALPQIEPQTISFSNSVSGKAEATTNFRIDIRRNEYFEAGEYELTLKLANGRTIGRKVKLRLQGDNKVINRKSIEFKAKDPEPESEEKKTATGDGEAPKRGASEDFGPDLSDIPDISDEEADALIEKPPPVEPKQGGGCGCRTLGGPTQGRGEDAPSRSLLLFMLALGATMTIARRRKGQA
ncbi:MAG: hypothetical protein AAGA56_30475 [Myxococcota bacterium]